MRQKIKSNHRPRLRALYASLGAAALTAPAAAAQFDYNMGYVGEYSTNITAVPTNPRSEWSNAAIVGVTYAENSDQLVARVASQVEYRDYVHNVVEDNVAYAIDASAIWTIAPRLFTWTFEDAARQVRVNPTAADSPANRSQANAFRTGPDVYFRMSELHTLSVGARYTNLYVNDSNLDNQSYGGIVRWLYQSTPQTTWSLNGERQRVEFDDEVANPNFRRNDAYLQLDKHFAQSQITLLGGVTRIEPDRSSDLSGSLARASWTHNITAESTVGLSAGTAFQDTRFELLGAVSAPTAPLTPVPVSTVGVDAVTADVFYDRYADAFFTVRGSRVEYGLRATARDLDFKTTAQDRKEDGVRVEFNYLASVTSTVGVFGSYLKTRFMDVVRADEDTDIGVRYGYRLTPHLTFGLEAHRRERRSTDPNSEFVDNRYLLSLQYSSASIRLPSTLQP